MKKRFRKKFNLKLFKKGDCYNIKELCRLLEISESTVFNWLKTGLQKANNCNHNLLFSAEDVKDFLYQKQSKQKQKCQEDEFFCFKCKKPVKPLGLMIDVLKIKENVCVLKSFCEFCDSKVNKNVSASKIPELGKIFDIAKGYLVSF